tara:strand:+ start:551 stop:886 length:336 start_codon:yes stop_codon:yes gene_type:complete
MIINMHTYFVPVEMAAALRQRSEPPWVEGLDDGNERMEHAAEILGMAGEVTGGMIILDEPDWDAAEAFDKRDPYDRAGLISAREIHRWRLRWSFGAFDEDGFEMRSRERAD